MSFSKHQIKTMVILVMIAGLGQGLIGIWQWLTSPGIYVTGTFDYEHHNYGVYIVYMTMLYLGVLLESRRTWSCLWLLLGIGALLFGVVFSFSRGAYVSIIAAIIVVLAMPHSRARKAVVGACTAVGAMVVLIVLTDVAARAHTIVQSFTGTKLAFSFADRLMMWKVALSEFIQNPLLGTGTWSYEVRDNFYVKILAESGILGFGAFIWLLFVMVRKEWHIIRLRIKDDFMRGISFALLPATVGCLIVFDLSGDHFLLHRFMATFWIVLALMIRYASCDEEIKTVQQQ
jgi:O-antigen ligase